MPFKDTLSNLKDMHHKPLTALERFIISEYIGQGCTNSKARVSKFLLSNVVDNFLKDISDFWRVYSDPYNETMATYELDGFFTVSIEHEKLYFQLAESVNKQSNQSLDTYLTEIELLLKGHFYLRKLIKQIDALLEFSTSSDVIYDETVKQLEHTHITGIYKSISAIDDLIADFQDRIKHFSSRDYNQKIRQLKSNFVNLLGVWLDQTDEHDGVGDLHLVLSTLYERYPHHSPEALQLKRIIQTITDGADRIHVILYQQLPNYEHIFKRFISTHIKSLKEKRGQLNGRISLLLNDPNKAHDRMQDNEIKKFELTNTLTQRFHDLKNNSQQPSTLLEKDHHLLCQHLLAFYLLLFKNIRGDDLEFEPLLALYEKQMRDLATLTPINQNRKLYVSKLRNIQHSLNQLNQLEARLLTPGLLDRILFIFDWIIEKCTGKHYALFEQARVKCQLKNAIGYSINKIDVMCLPDTYMESDSREDLNICPNQRI